MDCSSPGRSWNFPGKNTGVGCHFLPLTTHLWILLESARATGIATGRLPQHTGQLVGWLAFYHTYGVPVFRPWGITGWGFNLTRHHPDYSLRSREVQASFSQIFKVQASGLIHTVLLRLWPDAPSQDKTIRARTGPPQGEWQCCLGRAVPRWGSPWASFDSCQLQRTLSTQNCYQIPHSGAGPVSPTPFPGAPWSGTSPCCGPGSVPPRHFGSRWLFSSMTPGLQGATCHSLLSSPHFYRPHQPAKCACHRDPVFEVHSAWTHFPRLLRGHTAGS